MCAVIEPNTFALLRLPPCEAGLRVMLGNLLQVPLPSTPRALPFRSRLFPLTVAPPPS
jgi:hypothetical protein